MLEVELNDKTVELEFTHGRANKYQGQEDLDKKQRVSRQVEREKFEVLIDDCPERHLPHDNGVKGITKAQVEITYADDATTETTGYAVCSSDDNFNKRLGRKVALERALDGDLLEKAERRRVWKTYHELTNRQYKHF